MLLSSQPYTLQLVDDAILLRFEESCVLDHECGLEKELNQLIRESNSRNLVVDFSGVGTCSSSVLSALLLARKQLLPIDGTVKLCCLRDSMRDKLGLLRLIGKVFRTYESVTEAVESLN